VYWALKNGTQTFCEVKLSEADFGKAPDDARHRAKLADIYKQVLSVRLEPARLEPLAFFDAYQFNLNIRHMVREDGSRLIFLLPRSNSGLWAQLPELLSGGCLARGHALRALQSKTLSPTSPETAGAQSGSANTRKN
jgi:hypothetical protein